jgi:integrase
MIYNRGGVWHYRFRFEKRQIRESTKISVGSQTNRARAEAAERKRRVQLEDDSNGVTKSQRSKLFAAAAEAWLLTKKPHLAPRSMVIERSNLKHLNLFLGNLPLYSITADELAAYQPHRQKQKASPKTINLELGTVRAVLRKNRMWGNIQPDVRMLKTNEEIGRALCAEEDAALITACGESRSRSLLPAVSVALSTAMRASEIRLLRWNQVDLARRRLIVGKSKTAAGTGRLIPLNDRAVKVLEFWASQFPDRKPTHYLFPSEKYGGAGAEDVYGFRGSIPYDTDLAKHRALETGLGGRQASSWRDTLRCADRRRGTESVTLQVSRSETHCVHANVGGGSSFERGRYHHGMERRDDRAHGEAIRARV